MIRNRAGRRRVWLRGLGRATFRLLTVACVIWGTFSAAAVFAIRYDLWPLADPADPEPTGTEESVAFHAAPTLDATNWHRVLSPQTILAVALSAPELGGFRGNDSAAAQIAASAALVWRTGANKALWRLLLQRPGCPCPADRVTRWDIARVLVDPFSGAVLHAHVSRGLSPADLRVERAAYAAGPEARPGES